MGAEQDTINFRDGADTVMAWSKVAVWSLVLAFLILTGISLRYIESSRMAGAILADIKRMSSAKLRAWRLDHLLH